MFAARRLARTAVRGARAFSASAPRAAMSPAFLRASAAGAFVVSGAVFATAEISAPVADCAAMPVYGVPGTNQERTFLACKPDAVQRGLVGDIIARFEKRGYKLVGLKMVWPSEAMAKQVRRGLGAL